MSFWKKGRWEGEQKLIGLLLWKAGEGVTWRGVGGSSGASSDDVTRSGVEGSSGAGDDVLQRRLERLIRSASRAVIPGPAAGQYWGRPSFSRNAEGICEPEREMPEMRAARRFVRFAPG